MPCVVVAIVGPFLIRASAIDPSTAPGVPLSPPSASYPLGTDNFGRDIFTRVLYGARVSLWIGLVVAISTGVIGAAIGILAAQFPRLDPFLMRCMDAL